jgi:prepilin-type N-terminal cleavage/methylation domain-containing protein
MLVQRLRAARANDNGFTLIELLIVVIVIGLLAGITIFGVDAFKNDGAKAACTADKKNVEIAAQAFYAKTGAYPATTKVLADNGYLKGEPAAAEGIAISAAGAVTGTGANCAP